MRILFWGTPEFAVPSLRALQEEGHAVVAVVTQPDRPAGRGRRLRPSAVKAEALEEGIPVLQPERPRGDEFLQALRSLAPELSVVVAYGHILAEDVLGIPVHGSVNVHASLLPELRGAAPVNWAIIRGHEQTGVSLIRMVLRMDAGPVLYRVAAAMPPEISAGELSTMLAEMGATALVEALAQMEAGSILEEPQDEEKATFAPKLERETVRLDWALSAIELGRWIRGCDPVPAAWSELRGEPVQLFAPEVFAGGEASPGTVVEADPRSGIAVATGSGLLRIGEVKPAGRSRMPSAAWVTGRGVAGGDRFE